jgi:hypothetical protein
MHFIAAMDPTNPRWETSEARTKRSATMWKIIVAAAGTSALTAMVVASCLDRDVARRDPHEPPFVETTSVTTPTTPGATVPTAGQAAPVAAAPSAATRDTTGGVAAGGGVAANGGGAADDTAGTTTSATTGTTTITSAPAATPVPGRQLKYTRVPLPSESVNGDTSTSGTNGTSRANGTNGARDAAPSAVDGGASRNDGSRRVEDPNRGSNPQAPSYSAGAGGFVTEAPYWGASAWTSDPNAGAGPFTTERNTPAYGSYGVVGAPTPNR